MLCLGLCASRSLALSLSLSLSAVVSLPLSLTLSLCWVTCLSGPIAVFMTACFCLCPIIPKRPLIALAMKHRHTAVCTHFYMSKWIEPLCRDRLTHTYTHIISQPYSDLDFSMILTGILFQQGSSDRRSSFNRFEEGRMKWSTDISVDIYIYFSQNIIIFFSAMIYSSINVPLYNWCYHHCVIFMMLIEGAYWLQISAQENHYRCIGFRLRLMKKNRYRFNLNCCLFYFHHSLLKLA